MTLTKTLIDYSRELNSVYFFFNTKQNDTFSDLYNTLIKSIREDGGVPYVIGVKKRYRSSPLATTLEYLSYAEILPKDAIDIFQRKLMWYRDNADENPKQKYIEDAKAWCASEGASVWSTSRAIIALSVSGYSSESEEFYKLYESVIWLCDQQINGTGWKFQKTDNCTITIPMTALAVMGLALFITNYPNYLITNQKKIINSIEKGIDYILKEKKNTEDEVYWLFREDKSITSTAWVLDIINILENNPNNKFSTLLVSNLSGNKEKIIKFLTENIKLRFNSEPIKTTENFVFEAGAKYSAHKNFHCFLPSVVRSLLNAGVSPVDPAILVVIKWLIDNRSNWNIPEYDSKNCSFSYAMALSLLVIWYKTICKTTYRFMDIRFLHQNKLSENISCIFHSNCVEIKKSRITQKYLRLMVIGLFMLSLISLGISRLLDELLYAILAELIVTIIIFIISRYYLLKE